jgi:ankyrin repeat protein
VRTLLMRALVTKQFTSGDIMSDANNPALVYVVSGAAMSMGSDGSQHAVMKGQGFGGELLWDTSCSTLKASSRTCSALVLSQADMARLREVVKEHIADFDQRLELHRAWYYGETGGGSESSEEVRKVVRSSVDAARCGDFDAIRTMSRHHKAHLNLSDPSALEGGAMHVAVLQKHHSCLDTLLELEASPNARSSSGHTPLHSGALVGDSKAVEKLLSANGNPNNSTCKLRTPLHIASLEGHLNTVKVLLKAAAKVDVQDARLVTPAHLAVRGGHFEIVKALLLAGCNLNKKDCHGRNVWNEARQWKDGDPDGFEQTER